MDTPLGLTINELTAVSRGCHNFILSPRVGSVDLCILFHRRSRRAAAFDGIMLGVDVKSGISILH